jgi:1-carboxybiuret hydrolase
MNSSGRPQSGEWAELHLEDLMASAELRPEDARFLAGALVPGVWYAHAQRVRRRYCAEVAKTFANMDVILAPATSYPGFPIGQAWFEIGGQRVPAAGHLGVFTLPTVAAPVADCGPLPLGAQIIVAPWREDLALRTGATAEALGAVASPSLVSTEVPGR